jgi:hypothetical protein
MFLVDKARWKYAAGVLAASALGLFGGSPGVQAGGYDGYATCSDQGCSLEGCYDQGCSNQGCSDQGCADQWAGGCNGCDSSCCGGCQWGHCTSVWGEFLYLQATGVDMVHAQQQDGLGGAGTVPFGKIAAADPNYEPGVRVGGNIGLSDCSSLAMSYAFYESSSASSIDAPTIAGGGGAVGSLVHHPGAAVLASAGPVDSSYDIEFQLADLEYRRLLYGDNGGWLNYSVGGRFGHLEQDFQQRGIFGGGAGGQINTDTSIDFDGAGMMFGLDGEHRIGRRRLSVYGNVGVSPMVGQFSSDYSMNNVTGGIALAQANWKDDRFVTLLDMELGVAWTSYSGRVRVSTGYTAAFWFNAITTGEFVDAVQASNYTNVDDTIAFDGAVSRIELRF